MTLKQAITILEQHNKWRTGSDIPMQKPAEITEALDIAVNLLKGLKTKSKEKNNERH